MIAIQRKKVLVLTVTNKCLTFTLAERSGDGICLTKCGIVPFSVDVAKDDCELVGCEIKNMLQSVGIKEHRCLVQLSLDKLMVKRWSLPDLEPDEVSEFIGLEASQEFLRDDLTVDYMLNKDGTMASVLAVPEEMLMRLEQILAAAGLKAVRMQCGIERLAQVLSVESAQILLEIDTIGINMMVVDRGDIVLIRQLARKSDCSAEGIQSMVSETVRQLKISLSQLPHSLFESLREVVISGDRRILEQLGEELHRTFEHYEVRPLNGVELERCGCGGIIEKRHEEHAAHAVAAKLYLDRVTGGFEFLQSFNRFESILSQGRKSPYKLRCAAATVLMIIGFILYLVSVKVERSNLESQLESIASEYKEAVALKEQVKYLDQWFSTRPRNLDILKEVTLAFPETGGVWATSLSISEEGAVIINGKASSQNGWLQMQDRLRKSKGVKELMVSQSRERQTDKDPVSFAFKFIWNGG